jgi:hypothetical protein
METGNRDGMSRREPIRAVGIGTGPYGSSVAVCLPLLAFRGRLALLRYCSCDLSPSDGSLVSLGNSAEEGVWSELRGSWWVCFLAPTKDASSRRSREGLRDGTSTGR